MRKRILGRSGIEVSPMGLGCWAMGGLLKSADKSFKGNLSWGSVDTNETISAIRTAIDLGINFFDTADTYGAGHSERILGKAVAGIRNQVIIATKFGDMFEENNHSWLGHNHPNGVVTADYVRSACEASLKRLGIDHIDLYQFHWGDYSPELAADLIPVLEDLVTEGKISWYGWSTGHTDRARVFASGEHCTAIQYNYNIFERNTKMHALCDELGLASIARGPLGMGLLTGKFKRGSKLPDDDVRSLFWNLSDGRAGNQLDMLSEIQTVLQQDGCSLPQAALRWLWTRSDRIISITGFRNQTQVLENAEAMTYGLLSQEQMDHLDKILGVDSDPDKVELID